MLLGITVAEVMTEPVETVDATATVREVARRFREHDIGSLVVVDGGKPTGIVTEDDLVNVVAAGDDPGSTVVGDVMASPVVTVEPDTSVVDAVGRFREHDVDKLPVTRGGELVGIVTTTDFGHYIPQVVHREWLREREPDVETRFRVRPETTYERDDWAFESVSGAEAGVAVGDRVEFSKTVDDDDVRSFAEVSGDTNRLHLDEEFAAETRFGGRIVHGTLVAALISAALARLPGLTIYLSQDLSFLDPVRIGERLTAVCEVVESLGRSRYVVTTDVLDEDGETVVEGEAVVVIDDLPDSGRPAREPVEE